MFHRTRKHVKVIAIYFVPASSQHFKYSILLLCCSPVSFRFVVIKIMK